MESRYLVLLWAKKLIKYRYLFLPLVGHGLIPENYGAVCFCIDAWRGRDMTIFGICSLERSGSVMSPLFHKTDKSRKWGSIRGHTWFRAPILRNRSVLCLLLVCSNGLDYIRSVPIGCSNLNSCKALSLALKFFQDLSKYIDIWGRLCYIGRAAARTASCILSRMSVRPAVRCSSRAAVRFMLIYKNYVDI